MSIKTTVLNNNSFWRLSVPVVAMGLLAMFNSASVYASGSSKPVTVYQHINFRGASLRVGEGNVTINDLKRSRVKNDRISSIRIDAGYEVLACQHSGLRGRCETFTSDITDLRTLSFNDTISSLKISKTTQQQLPVTLYKHVNFRGRSLSVGEGEVSIRDLKRSVGNDAISSIIVAPGYEVLACKHRNFGGRCETFTADISDLRTISFNDVISSLRVTDISQEPPVNAAPVASNVTFDTEADAVLTFSLQQLASNVTDADGDALSLSVPSNNVVTDNGNSTFTFDPTTDFSDLPLGETATVSFFYEVSDGQASDTATITITIQGTFALPVNIAPVAEDVDFETLANSALEISLLELSDSVSDANGDALSLSIPSNDSVTDNGDGTFSFDPTADFSNLISGDSATVSFPYEVTDGEATATAMVNIRIFGVLNVAPVANDIAFTTPANTALLISRADFDVSDANGDLLLITVLPNDLVTDNGDGSYTFDPTIEFANLLVGQTATVSLVYSVSDGVAEDTAMVNITIEGTALPVATYNIGDLGPGGGTVFAVSADGTSGLEFAPQLVTDAVAGTIEWGCRGTNIDALPDLSAFDSVTGEPVEEIQSGLLNITALEAAPAVEECDPVAAQAALGYEYTTPSGDLVDDWYLPSIAELLEIQENFANSTVQDETSLQDVVLSTQTLWSSTEHTADLAWSLNMAGNVGIPSKDSFGAVLNVLPVRSF